MQLLNGLSPQQFLDEYWQKKPLLIRQAIPGFTGLLSPNDLAGLACEDDVQARLISLKKNQWAVQHGPFDETDFTRLPKQDWTLLVQGVNHYVPGATALMAMFNFIPHARLDDLMVSYAPKGGGVGPHLDSYDVFLLQGLGRRNWKISAQTDHQLIENAPLKILQHFETEQEWVLESGDMLYLPPQIAHWGIADSDDCMTYSIGFRAPAAQELGQEFLGYMQEQLCLNGMYADPDLTLQKHPAEISTDMVRKVSAMLRQIQWNEDNVGDFLGRYLSEPKPHVVFEPNKKISQSKFATMLREKTLSLDLKSQMLFWQKRFYLNGELLGAENDILSANILATIQALADNRVLPAMTLNEDEIACLAQWFYPAYLAGFVEFAA
ncbi:MAG TPA: cupin domain-containing protein [Methylophilus sp.]|nr:cupin domain-containing protein [Methylophilus sp.]HQQ34036.1 cupin domain-containing protein [Methylophilus sp.]